MGIYKHFIWEHKEKGDYIVLQHNDTFYHNDIMDELINKLNNEKLGYISVDCKKVWMSTYLSRKRLLDKYIDEGQVFA